MFDWRIGDERADRPSVVGEVRPQNSEGVFLSRRGDRVDVLFFRPPILEHVARPFKRRVGTERVYLLLVRDLGAAFQSAMTGVSGWGGSWPRMLSDAG